jgi:hypothetical protein
MTKSNIQNIQFQYLQNQIKKVLIRKDLINKKKELWQIK